MSWLHWILIFLIVQLMLGSKSALCSEAPRAEELEKKAITYRLENIKRGHVRLHVINDNPPTECLFDITFDEHRVRQTRQYRKRGQPDWKGPEKFIVTPDKYIADRENTAVPLVVSIAPATNYKSPREHFGVLNLQALGMTANGAAALHIDHIESLMNRSDRNAPKVSKDVYAGLDTWRIDYEIKKPQKEVAPKVALWIAPSQGFSVVGIEIRSDQNGKRYSSRINTQMKQYPEKEVWYPHRLIKILKADDRIINRQEVIVEEARFGSPIDEAAFTPTGLDMQPGREVVDSTSGMPWLKIWNGKELVSPSSVQTAPPHPERSRWLLWTLAAGLALIAVFYFWRVIRQRRSPTSQES